MPVPLHGLPARLPEPAPPEQRRWMVAIIGVAFATGFSIFLLWPAGHWRLTPWFWCCVVLLPIVVGMVVYGIRSLAYERRMEYVGRWNKDRSEQKALLVEQGQRMIAVMAVAYNTPAGCSHLSLALRQGSKPLRAVYVPLYQSCYRMAQLTPVIGQPTLTEYHQRLSGFLTNISRTLTAELKQMKAGKVHVRIRHNNVLNDDVILKLWQESACVDELSKAVEIAGAADGLLWLDQWLDKPDGRTTVLSIEINLHLDPIDGEAETISAVLLSLPGTYCTKQLPPIAMVHRPVLAKEPLPALQMARSWGRCDTAEVLPFIWSQGVSTGRQAAIDIALVSSGFSYRQLHRYRMDDAFGNAGCAGGNLALITAAEQAATDSSPQLILLQDKTLQWCVVRPAGAHFDKESI